MNDGESSRPREGLAAVGLAALAVACCGALPLLAALAGGVAIGTVLGIGAGVLVLGALVALIVIWTRGTRRCQSPKEPHRR